MEKKPLFLFGECTEAAFLAHFPVSLQSVSSYTLPGYALRYAENGRSFLTPSSGEQVSGLLCDAQEDLLWAMDQWKGVPLLRRTTVKASCGELYVYENNAAVVCDAPELTPEAALTQFSGLYAENELGKCDVHLMFPCSFENFHCPVEEAAAADAVTANFLSQINRANAEEFNGEYLTLRRGALGVYSFRIGFSEADRAAHTQPGFVYYSIHETTQIGTVSIVFPNTLVSALQILNVFCSDMLEISGSGCFRDWLQRECGLTIHGTPRAVLFAHNPLENAQVIKCLAMERNPMAPLIGPTLQSYAADNLAQYDLAEVYASPKCLLEIEKSCCCDLSERLGTESLEIFFVELLSMQTASVQRICSRVLNYMKETEELGGEKDYEQLISLSNEMSSVILFFDYDRFLYPTVTIACKKISQRFGMEEELQKYYQYREILEQMISVAHEQREKIEGDNLNLLLLILTLVQVLPTFVDTFQMFLEGTWSASILWSWLYSIIACALLCALFSWYKRRQIRRANSKHKRRK